MAMKNCKDCGTQISSGAKICPNCGKDQRNFFMKHKIITFILVIFFIGMIATATNSNKNNVTTTSTDTSTSSEIKEKKQYNIGETFQNDYIKLTLISVNQNFTSYSKYATVKDGCKIIKAEFELENIGSTDTSALYTNFNCYADGYACDEFYSVDDAGLSGAFNTTLSSGKKTKGNVYFQVPTNAEKITIEYDTNFWTSENIEFIVK